MFASSTCTHWQGSLPNLRGEHIGDGERELTRNRDNAGRATFGTSIYGLVTVNLKAPPATLAASLAISVQIQSAFSEADR